MQSTVGIFDSLQRVQQAIVSLQAEGIPEARINVLHPGNLSEELGQVPVSETEQPGMGKAVGGLLGGALGVAGGLSAGTAVASLLVPGVGPVVAIGLAAAGILGAGGAVAGAAAGNAVERETTEGLPEDELFLYEDALRQGRTVVIAFAETPEEAEKAQQVLRVAGAESLDAARERWWIGLRSAEQEHYRTANAAGQTSAEAESIYRKGFEAALHPSARGKDYSGAADFLRVKCPDICTHPLFVRGYERGCEYDQRRKSSQQQAPTEKHAA